MESPTFVVVHALTRWFAAPTLDTPSRTQASRFFHVTAWGFAVVSTAMLGVLVVLEPHTFWRRVVSAGSVAVLVAVLHEINRRGRTALASWGLVLGLVGILTQRAWITGGLHAPITVFYILFVLIAGSLLGFRASVVTALVCLAGGAILLGAELSGYVAPPTGTAGPVPLYAFLLLGMGLTLVVQILVTRRQEASLTVARTELAERRRVEAELRRHQDDLEALVTERTGELQDTVRQLGEAEQLRDDLTHMIVHDMRSPLTVMMSSLGILQQDATPEQAETLAAAIESTRNLQRFANTLLDVSRLEAGRLPLTRIRVDLVSLAREVMDALGVVYGDRRIELDAAHEVTCDLDADLTRRVIDNIVSNALRHTPPRGCVRIGISQRGRLVRLTVSDEGPGIPAELRGRIFDKFGAAPLRRRGEYHSVGLGLAFCKLAVEAHGGAIQVADAVPHGSVFTVELPC